MEKLNEALAELEQALGGTLGVYALSLEQPNVVVRYGESEPFPAASTIKVFILQTLLEHVHSGRAALDEEILLDPDDQVTGSGVLKALTPGKPYSLRDLATLMIIVSDNSATNLLIERLGIEAVNSACQRWSWSSTQLAGKLQKGLTYASSTSPRDLGDYFARLWRGELLPDDLTEVAQTIYRQQQLTAQLGSEIGYDAYSTETGASTLVIASKSGSVRGVRNDAGVIEAPWGRYALAVMTKGCADERYHPNNLGSQIVSKVSKVLFDHFRARSG